jgi:glucans biosynthesis protein C
MKKERRYDIDWIRVIVFDILIIYHVGMFFVSWGWHIKNNEIIDWMRWPMLFVNQWRLPILFIISGMGTRFALSQRTGANYLLERFKRLFIPLVVGILLVVAPQVYIERIVQGKISGSFFDFYPHFFHGIYPEGNFSWHHLWFLPYLLLLSVIATPIFLNLRKDENRLLGLLNKFIKKSPPLLYLFALPLFIVEVFLEPLFPITHALIGDWYALIYYFILFITGYILISLGKAFWLALDRIKYYSLTVGVISFPLLILIWYTVESSIFIPLIKTLNMWSWIITIFAFCSKYLNGESKLIKYRNQAVYPFYIMHQTIIIIIAYWLINNPMHYMWKFTILVLGTFACAWILYEFIIRRIPIMRPLFGLKKIVKIPTVTGK